MYVHVLGERVGVRGPALEATSPAKLRLKLQESGDRKRNCFDIVQHIFVTEANDAPARGLKMSLSRLISLVNIVVITAIDFDGQTQFYAGEIDDERLNRELTSEFQSA